MKTGQEEHLDGTLLQSACHQDPVVCLLRPLIGSDDASRPCSVAGEQAAAVGEVGHQQQEAETARMREQCAALKVQPLFTPLLKAARSWNVHASDVGVLTTTLCMILCK